MESETDLAADERMVERVKRLVAEFDRLRAGADGADPECAAMPAAPSPARVP